MHISILKIKTSKIWFVNRLASWPLCLNGVVSAMVTGDVRELMQSRWSMRFPRQAVIGVGGAVYALEFVKVSVGILMVGDLMLRSKFGGSISWPGVFVELFLATSQGTDGLWLKDNNGKVWVRLLGLLNFCFRPWIFLFYYFFCFNG